jgi:hypothetical protein
VELVPVVEFAPSIFSSADRTSPTRGGWEDPNGWDDYWRASLADAGVTGLDPVRVGSWCVPAAHITNAAVLDVFVEKVLRERLHVPAEELEMVVETPLAVVPGGHALIHDGTVVVEPQCCCDLTNLSEWRDAAAYRGADWRMLWIGHPWVGVRFRGELLEMTEPGALEEGDHPAEARYAIDPGRLRAAISRAALPTRSFQRRLLAAVEARGGFGALAHSSGA